MKKTNFCLLFLLLLIFMTGCGESNVSTPTKKPKVTPTPEVIKLPAKTPAPIVTPNITESPTPDETPVVTPTPTETPVMTPAPTETPAGALHWDEIFDYSQAQPKLTSDGDIKNLSIQFGNTTDTLHITWFSRSGEQGHVNFLSDTGEVLSSTVSTQGSVSVPNYYRNRAVISGLKPSTHYKYQVGNGDVFSPYYSYITKDPVSSAFSFTIAGDPEIGLGDLDDMVYEIHSNDWRRSLNRMKENNPESAFLLTLGDHVARKAAPEEYDLFLDQSVLYSTALMPVVGNHDAGSGFFGDHFYLPNKTEHGVETGDDGDYWFVYGDVLFMVLNNLSSCDDVDHQLFIQETIEQNPDTKWRVLASHYSPVSNVERYQGSAESVNDYFDYAELFDIDLFFGGHDHIYTRSYLMTDDDEFLSTPEQTVFHNPEGALYVIFSTATSSLYREPDNYPWAAYSVQTNSPQISRATVTDTEFTVSTYEADTWTLVDSFTIYKD